MEPNQTSGEIAWAKLNAEQQDKVLVLLGQTIASLNIRLEALENEVRNSVKRRDSVEIGTPGKNGAIKVYIDASDTKEHNALLIENAKDALRLAGGTPQAGGA